MRLPRVRFALLGMMALVAVAAVVLLILRPTQSRYRYVEVFHRDAKGSITAVLNRMAYVSASGRLGRDPAIGQSWVSTQPTRNSPEALSNATRL